LGQFIVGLLAVGVGRLVGDAELKAITTRKQPASWKEPSLKHLQRRVSWLHWPTAEMHAGELEQSLATPLLIGRGEQFSIHCVPGRVIVQSEFCEGPRQKNLQPVVQ